MRTLIALLGLWMTAAACGQDTDPDQAGSRPLSSPDVGEETEDVGPSVDRPDGGSQTVEDMGFPDESPPMVDLIYPARDALVTGSSLTLVGRASDEGRIAAVRVNGRTVDTVDDFRTWTATVSVPVEGICLVVSAEDDEGNAAPEAASVWLGRSTGIGVAFGQDWDPARRRVLFFDQQVQGVFGIDLRRSYVFPISIQTDPGPSFGEGLDLAFDSTRDVIYTANRSPPGIYAIDSDGNRSVLSGSDSPGLGLERPIRLAVDQGRIFVFDPGSSGTQRLFEVDASTGARTVLLDSSSLALGTVTDIEVDVSRDEVYLMDRDRDELIAVAITSGSTRVLSSNPGPGQGPIFRQNNGLGIDRTAGILYSFDLNRNVLAIDMLTGDRVEVSTGRLNHDVRSVLVDAEEDRLLMMSSFRDRVIAVDRSNGIESVVAGAFFPRGVEALRDAVDLAGEDASIIVDAQSGLLRFDGASSSTIGPEVESASRAHRLFVEEQSVTYVARAEEQSSEQRVVLEDALTAPLPAPLDPALAIGNWGAITQGRDHRFIWDREDGRILQVARADGAGTTLGVLGSSRFVGGMAYDEGSRALWVADAGSEDPTIFGLTSGSTLTWTLSEIPAYIYGLEPGTGAWPMVAVGELASDSGPCFVVGLDPVARRIEVIADPEDLVAGCPDLIRVGPLGRIFGLDGQRISQISPIGEGSVILYSRNVQSVYD
ncbi:MAG: hypothetical protein AAF851_20170 [Myxococcota bacterium]